MKLNLGASDRAIPGYVSVDLVPPAEVIADLAQPWPWPDSSIDAVKAFDVIEHIADRIHVMNELWRVMKPGSQVEIEVPNAAKGAGAFQDPTHCSYWTLNSFQYFEDKSFAHQRFAKAYGITARFRISHLSQRPYLDVREEVWKIRAVLEAVK